jgi:hypothetical protein
MALASAAPAIAQTVTPTYLKGNQITGADATVILDKTGVPFGTATNPVTIFDPNTSTLANSVNAPIPAQTTHGVNIGGVEGITAAGTPGGYPITIQGNAAGVPVPVTISGASSFTCTGSCGGGPVTQSGSWNVGLTGTLPAFAATPTVNIGTVPTVGVTGTFWQATQPVSGSVTATPLFSTPVAYTSGSVFNALAYGTVILTCVVAPSAGTIAISPDNNNDFIGQTAALNTASGITTTVNVTATGVYTIAGHQYVKATLTGGTCFIAGGQ